MISKKNKSIFVTTFLIIGFFFLALPEKGYSGVAPIGCCITDLGCIDIISGEIHLPCITTEVLGGSCTEESIEGLCLESEVSNVPTLSEWGLIALAGILGIVGFMVMRRRKVTA
jgi:hypothetical protein